MSSPLGQYGSASYQSPETRALGQFATDKFSYREQGKNIIELNNAVGFMSGYMRKMQRGIDEANQNFIQQIQGLINDLLVLIGGGGDTGFEWGDFKYVIQAIGALFGFTNDKGEITLPINLFDAAWHFISEYVLPVDNFKDFIDMIIDSFIATVLDYFGEVPIVGQALQQLAVIISDLRDLLDPIAASLDELLGAFNIDIGDLPGIANIFGPFAPIVQALIDALDGIVLPDFSLVLHEIAQWTLPFIESIAAVIEALTYIVKLVTGQANLEDLPKVLLNIISPLDSLNLFNLVPTDIMGQVSASAIGTAITNLLTDPNFIQDAYNDILGWLHIPGGASDGTGAIQAVADGTTKELLGNWIPVSSGQVLPISGLLKWVGLVGTGNPVGIGITGYDANNAAIDQKTVASHNTTPTTTDWLTLSGTYTVPANVTQVRTRLMVSSTATAGIVSFSKMKATKSQPLLQKLIAGTNAGEFLPDDVGHLFNGILLNAQGLLTKVEQQAHDDLLKALGSQNLQDIENRINSFLNSLSPLNASNINNGSVADDFVPGVKTILDNIVTQLLNIGGSNFSHDDALDALKHQSAVDTETSARLAQLENIFTNGVSDGDDFERKDSSSIGTGWLTYYKNGTGKGVWATPNGHDAAFSTNGISDQEFLCVRNTGQIQSTSNMQRCVMVIGAAATRMNDALLGTYNFAGHNDIWLRIRNDITGWANVTGIRYRFGGDGSMSICRFVNGVNLDAATALSYLPPDSVVPPGPGSSIWAEAGTPGTARFFRCGIGTSTYLYVSEVGTASVADTSCLRWGHGGRAEGSTLPLPTQQRPASVHQETRKDQVA